jgi:hypothetical protein
LNDPTRKSAVVRGWILIVLGAFLAIGMGCLTAWFAATVNNTSQQGSHWNGTRTMTMQVYELFAAVIFFGLVSAAAGTYQVRYGRLNKIAFAAMLLLIGVMFWIGKGIVANAPS